MVEKYQPFFNRTLKIIAIFFALLAIYKFIEYSPWKHVSIVHPISLFLALLLMPLNWCLESKRWQILLKPLFPISFRNALLGVLSGLGVSFMVGKIIGSALGRYWSIPKSIDRKQSIGALLISQLTQGIHTYWIGIPCLIWYLRDKMIVLDYKEGLFVGVFIVSILLLLMITQKRTFNVFFRKIFQKYFVLLNEYNFYLIFKITILGGLRYGVFTLQFILIIYSLNTSISLFLLFSIIPIVFLIKTVSPNLGGFLDLGIREISTLYIFESLGLDPNIALVSSLLIWSINILIPSLVGLGVKWRL